MMQSGRRFQLPYAAGVDGGILSQLIAFDRGTANAALRVHLFSTAFSASQNGVTFQVNPADYHSGLYLGWVDIATADWVTGGTAQNMARVTGQPINLNSMSGARVIQPRCSVFGAPRHLARPPTPLPRCRLYRGTSHEILVISDDGIASGYGRISMWSRRACTVAASSGWQPRSTMTAAAALERSRCRTGWRHWLASPIGGTVVNIIGAYQPDVIMVIQDAPYAQQLRAAPIDWSRHKLVVITPVDGAPVFPAWVDMLKQADGVLSISQFGVDLPTVRRACIRNCADRELTLMRFCDTRR